MFRHLAADHAHIVNIQAYGKAIAVAISEVLLDCFVKGQGYACAMGQADINAVASVRIIEIRNSALSAVVLAVMIHGGAWGTVFMQATAEAFASAAVKAVTGCGCSLSGDALASSLTEVTVKAISDAYGEGCAGATQTNLQC